MHLCFSFWFVLTVKSDEQSDLLESKSLKGDVQGKLAEIDKNEKEIHSLKGQVKFLSSQV